MTASVQTIDATGRPLGRVASEAAELLRGKGLATFERHHLPRVKVIIINANQTRITPKKMKGKIYTRYTGYPGGLRQETLAARISRQGHKEIIRQAIAGMIPANKLKPRLLKNLEIKN